MTLARVAACVAASLVTGNASTASLSCPLELVASQTATAPAPEWAVSYETYPLRLSGMSVFDGPPDEQADLKYHDSRKANREWTVRWRLAPNPRGYWLMCRYDGTRAQVSRRIPDGATRCTGRYDLTVAVGAGPLLVEAVCE